VRGRNGGLRLGEQTLSVTIGDVVRVTASDFALVLNSCGWGRKNA